MKPARLLLSAALASLMLLAPAVITKADAAGIKIKPQIVKVRPKVKIAKPKVRIKVRAAKIRIKPKIRTKVRAAKIQVKPKIRAKVRAANVRIKPKLQVPLIKLSKKPRVISKVHKLPKADVAAAVAAANTAAIKRPRRTNRGSHVRGGRRYIRVGGRRHRTPPVRHPEAVGALVNAAASTQANPRATTAANTAAIIGIGPCHRHDIRCRGFRAMRAPRHPETVGALAKAAVSTQANPRATTAVKAAASRGPISGTGARFDHLPSIIGSTGATNGTAGSLTHLTNSLISANLVVNDYIGHVFDVRGGNMNDHLRHHQDLEALRGMQAMKDLATSGLPNTALPGRSALGPQRIGTGSDGMPANPSSQISDPGHAGFSYGPGEHRYDPETGRDTTRYVADTPHGQNILVESGFTNSDGNRVHTTTEIIPLATGGRTRIHTVNVYHDNPDGSSQVETHTTVTTPKQRTRSTTNEITLKEPIIITDGKGDGKPSDDVKTSGKDPKPDGAAKAGNPGDQGWDPGNWGKNADKWTPMGGIVQDTTTMLDKLSQPGTDEQGTVTLYGSANPNVGAAAVTNTGDGSFAGNGRAGGGGVNIDPCVAVRSGGCGGSDPGIPGPEGAVADAGTASSH